jgi:ATP-dependent exoDNAse (exonuclease V) beta subunit
MNQPDLLQLDADNRRRAIEPASFIVEAPAGAGKTELLTQRYLKLLSGVNEPEEIVAITFTNKAAAEMRGRVLQSLQDAADQQPATQPHKQVTRELALAALARSNAKHWDLLAQPARLRINTIDSLCSLLARQMPLLSRLGGQPAVSDDASIHYREAALRTLAMLEGETGNDTTPIADALNYLDNDTGKLSELLASMLARRDQWLTHAARQPIQEEAESALRHLIRQDIQRAAASISARVQNQLMPLARYAASNLPCEDPIALLLDWETPIPASPEALPMWRALCELLLTQKDEWRKSVTVKQGFPAGEANKPHKEALAEVLAALPDPQALARIRKLPQPGHDDTEWRIIGSLAALLRLAAAHLTTVFQEAGEVDFVEIASRALIALGEDTDPTDMALRLDYRIQHLLVDEFQDTSPSQVRLLEKLTAGWQPDDGRTIFCVGDPMQSIYRFRKAEVGLFLQVADSGIGHLLLEPLSLTRNNRSCPAVVDWVNTAFARVFPSHDNATSGSIRYRPFAATRAPLPDEGVYVHPLLAENGTASDAMAGMEASEVARLIAELSAADPERTIAVLVRARSHLTALVANIRKHHKDIRFQAVEIEALAGRQVIQDLLALTHALLHRADRINWLAILRAPWCGLTFANLHILAADNHRATIWSLMNDQARIERMSQDGQQRLLHVRSILAETLANRGRQSLRRWIEGIWLTLGGAQCLWEASDVNDVQALLDLIGRLDAKSELAKLSQEAEKLYASADTATNGRLQFMTIHKSKGLEFDTVILPGLHRDSRGDDSPLVLWEEVPLEHGETELVAAPMIPKDQRKDTPAAYDYLRLLEKERSANEDARVLYVATTRAIRSLHMVGVARLDSSGEPRVAASTPLGLLWSTVAGSFAEAAVSVAEAAIDNANFTPDLIRRSRAGIPAALEPKQAATSRAANPEPSEKETTHHQLEADIGTLAHRYVELMTQSGLDGWDAHRIASLAPAMARWLQQCGHPENAAQQGAARVIAALSTTINSETGRWVLAARPQAESELALMATDNQRIGTHIIDRTFIENGTRWIIDYKSTDLGSNIDALKQEAQQYRPQLDRYAGLFIEEGLPVRTAIFFLAHGQLVTLD